MIGWSRSRRTAAVRGGAAPVTDALPDLVADPPGNSALQTYSHPGQPNHLLLRFEGYVHNRGAGALEVRGSGPAGGRMSATAQRIYRSNGTLCDDTTRNVQMVWEPRGRPRPLAHPARRALLAVERGPDGDGGARDEGRLLPDRQPAARLHGPGVGGLHDRPRNNFCGQEEPTMPSLVEGISAGWRDVYVRTLAFQWVDVSDVQPGDYWLRSEVDPDNWARESNESNAAAYAHESFDDPGLRRAAGRRRDRQHHRARRRSGLPRTRTGATSARPSSASPRLRATAG